MKNPYSFLYKAVAAFLCIISAMGVGFCLLALLYSYAVPEAPNMPAAFVQERDMFILAGGLCLFSILICLTYLLRAAGRRNGDPDFQPGWQEKIPLDLYLVVTLLLGGGVISLGIELVEHFTRMGPDNVIEYLDVVTMMLMGVPLAGLFMAVALALLMSLAVRFKIGGWWRNSILYWCWKLVLRICRWAWNLWKRFWGWVRDFLASLPAIWPVAISVGSFLFIAFLLAAPYPSGMAGLFWLGISIVIFIGCCYGATQFGEIQKAAQRLAAGDLSASVEVNHRTLPIFRNLGNSINSIGAGMHAAVEEQLKSERFKTELITNVSHDLKTPLTSIINYVDLLGKEELPGPKATEYVEVLRRQANRLKKLTEDLIEASKASTGNIHVERVRTDVGELLSQCSAEYGQRMEAAQLAMVCNAPAGLYAMADGRLLWRIFDNLLGNACKYAQPGTRVYLTAYAQAGRVHIEIKNISRDVLNISAEELMERFVRGDSSRHAEGSGLGLSIARSLAELNGGGLTLYVDGDLFKATVDLDMA